MPSKMFEVDGKRVVTFNPITGCHHNCTYCYARRLAETRLKKTIQYAVPFDMPHIARSKLDKSIGRNKIVFVGSMGDMWGDWIPLKDQNAVLAWCRRQHDSNTFYFLTKNPSGYKRFLEEYPGYCDDHNFVWGATIETTMPRWRYEKISKAPEPFDRSLVMQVLPVKRKFISIEPIMELDLSLMYDWVDEISPEFIYTGYDNHRSNLPDLSLPDFKELVEALQKITEVRLKNTRGLKFDDQ